MRRVSDRKEWLKGPIDDQRASFAPRLADVRLGVFDHESSSTRPLRTRPIMSNLFFDIDSERWSSVGAAPAMRGMAQRAHKKAASGTAPARGDQAGHRLMRGADFPQHTRLQHHGQLGPLYPGGAARGYGYDARGEEPEPPRMESRKTGHQGPRPRRRTTCRRDARPRAPSDSSAHVNSR